MPGFRANGAGRFAVWEVIVRRVRVPLAWLLLLAVAPTAAAVRADDGPVAQPKAEPAPDVFAEALKEARLSVDDLGLRPRGSWARYPSNPPFKLPFFDDLLAHPLDTYEFTRTLGNAVEDLLTPEKLTAAPEKDRPESLYSLAVNLATARRIGGFRGFGMDRVPGVDGAPWATGGFEDVLLYSGIEGEEVQRRLNLNPGGKYKRDWIGIGKAIDRLLHFVVAARLEIDRGLHHTTLDERKAAWVRSPSFVANLPDGGEGVTGWEDLVARIDAMSLAHGSLLAISGIQRARRELEAAKPKDGWPDFEFRDDTPWGEIVIVARKDRKPIELPPGPAPLLLVALTPVKSVAEAGSTAPDRTLSVALFLDGVEHLGSLGADAGRTGIGGVASGILGCGIVYVAGNGKTTYESASYALGCGILGTGILVDEGGDDVYRVRNVGEGAGVFGAGLLLDAAGNDRYELLSGDGQGFGGPGGIGILADRSGDDVYFAEPLPEKAGKDRADDHSDQKIVGSNAQGAGMGRRGDMNDGHDWAGGLGALLDIDGNDTYSAGNFSQGVGYWFGSGLLYDGGGDDTYDSVYFSHGSGAHFAIGAVVDEGGNDVHRLSDFPRAGFAPKAWPGAGIAFGWDVVNAFVFDRAGNDRYESSIISEGVSNIRSFALLLDEGGDDTYIAQGGAAAFGAVDEQPYYVTPHRTSPFAFHLPQAAMLLDLGGTDRYLRVPAAGGESVPDPVAGDDKTWSREAAVGPGAGRNVVIGKDVARGRAGFLDAWPRRGAPK